MKKASKKLFSKLKMNWPTVIIMAVALGIWTALMAMLAPDGSSFHDIAVTAEWWVLPAIIIILNCKTPLDAALKTFVFFLISQPLVYLIQVPFNYLGWEIFKFYPYWLVITLFTFPGAFITWFVKKDKWYSGIILAIITTFLALHGINYLTALAENFPNHLLSILYCFGTIPILISIIFKKWPPRAITISLTLIGIIVFIIITMPFKGQVYETYNNTFIRENNVTLVGKPSIVTFTATADCDADECVEIVSEIDETYVFKLRGRKGGEYTFEIEDESEASYTFTYRFDEEQNTVTVNLVDQPSSDSVDET